MVEGGGGAALPVVFFDGEREINISDVYINPTLEYKPFQHMISQKIGISPNQISIYLVDRKRNHKSSTMDEHRRIPITGKVNFGVICRMKDCCFLVVLKRSRKSRNRRDFRSLKGVESSDYMPDYEFSPPSMHPQPGNMILLRRNQPIPFYDQITRTELEDLNDRLQNLRIQRENYEMRMARGSCNPPNIGYDPNLNPFLDSFPVLDESIRIMKTNNEVHKIRCEECEKSNYGRETTLFHPCVNDVVISQYRTRFGPVERPNTMFP